jgi:hypothetical protein
LGVEERQLSGFEQIPLPTAPREILLSILRWVRNKPLRMKLGFALVALLSLAIASVRLSIFVAIFIFPLLMFIPGIVLAEYT